MLKLMMVEDDPLLQRLYERTFRSAGYDIMLAKDGTIVYETVLLKRPDLIIMDVMMPNINGLMALEEIKSNPETRSIPVIMFSANDDEQVVQKALQLGAERYLLKSKMEPKEFVRIVNELVGKNT